MKLKFATALFALATLAGSANAEIINVIKNGDFENGRSQWTLTGNVDYASQTQGGFYWGGGSVAQNGTRAIAFNSGDRFANGTLSQSFATVQGYVYRVSFDYGSTSPSPQSMNYIVLAGNTTLANGKVTDNNVSGLLDNYRFSFVGTGGMTTLRFLDANANNSISNDGLLDNVRVEVPEPASMALMGLGLLGLGFGRRRKAA